VKQPVDPSGKSASRIAEQLNHLFATQLSPSGRPYTLTEVSEATGLAVPYLSVLRKGTIQSVSFDRIERLARFFDVPLDYFSHNAPPLDVDLVDAKVRKILADPNGREFLLRAGDLGPAERALILQMIEHAQAILERPKGQAVSSPVSSDAAKGGHDDGAAPEHHARR